MTLIYESTNSKLSSILEYVSRYLEEHGVHYSYSMPSTGYANSHNRLTFYCSGVSIGIANRLNYIEARVEAVEETPGAITSCVSEKGSNSFKYTFTYKDIDTSMYDFEDEESYRKRMESLGVRV